MPTLTTKVRILEEAGFKYNFLRMLYFNQSTKKAFSVEFVEDHSEDEIKNCLAQNTDPAHWTLYNNGPVSETVKRELEKELG